mgnify:CR=1 FL=1
MELILDKLEISYIKAFFEKVKHIKSNLNLDVKYLDKTVGFNINMQKKEMTTVGGPYFKHIPTDEWFSLMLTNEGSQHKTMFNDIDDLVSKIYTILNLVVMPFMI